jgi:hypothetical protein
MRARERMRADPADSPRHLLEAMLVMRDAPDSTITDDQIGANGQTSTGGRHQFCNSARGRGSVPAATWPALKCASSCRC